jgi:hypothetical protein
LELSHEFAINHLEQWFIQFAPHLMQPFMVGLTSQALMLYYLEINQDPRIPYLLKITCDWLWDNYCKVPNNCPFRQQVVNMSDLG